MRIYLAIAISLFTCLMHLKAEEINNGYMLTGTFHKGEGMGDSWLEIHGPGTTQKISLRGHAIDPLKTDDQIWIKGELKTQLINVKTNDSKNAKNIEVPQQPTQWFLWVEVTEAQKITKKFEIPEKAQTTEKESKFSTLGLKKGMTRQDVESKIATLLQKKNEYSPYANNLKGGPVQYIDGPWILDIQYKPGTPAPTIVQKNGNAQHFPPIDETITSFKISKKKSSKIKVEK